MTTEAKLDWDYAINAKPKAQIDADELKSLRDENIRLKVKLQMAQERFDEITVICDSMQHLLEKMK